MGNKGGHDMPSLRNADPLLAVISAMPEMARSTETVAAIADAVAKADPSYWLRPLTAAEAAAFLSTTPGALAQQRFRGDGPPCWGRVNGSIRYGSRRELLVWMRQAMGLDVEMPSGRRAA
jgi:hypothetical protein